VLAGILINVHPGRSVELDGASAVGETLDVDPGLVSPEY
jgi:hypothetical protein